MRELLKLIEQVGESPKDYGEEFIPELVADLKATTDALIREMEEIR